MIEQFKGDDLGVYQGENYLLAEWNGRGKVVFSMTRRGDAMLCHFSAEKKALRDVKQAVAEFIAWVFYVSPWCKMICAPAYPKSGIERMLRRFGFLLCAHDDEGRNIFMRVR